MTDSRLFHGHDPEEHARDLARITFRPGMTGKEVRRVKGIRRAWFDGHGVDRFASVPAPEAPKGGEG